MFPTRVSIIIKIVVMLVEGWVMVDVKYKVNGHVSKGFKTSLQTKKITYFKANHMFLLQCTILMIVE